jgi:hypothetical protein
MHSSSVSFSDLTDRVLNLRRQDQAGQDPVNPPFVFGVTTAQGEVYFKGTGTKKLGDITSGGADADTVFWVCSQSKLITHVSSPPVYMCLMFTDILSM